MKTFIHLKKLERVKLHEEVTVIELQVFLRDLLKILLRDERFIDFSHLIDVEDAPDY